MQGFVKEPWFIATLIGTIGGTLWFALCVFSIWLYRKKKARKKLHKNGVMTGVWKRNAFGGSKWRSDPHTEFRQNQFVAVFECRNP